MHAHVCLCVCVSLFRSWMGVIFWGGMIETPVPPCGGNEPEDKQRLA